MKKRELLLLLEKVDDDAEIVVCPVPSVISYCNDILPRLGKLEEDGSVAICLKAETTTPDEPNLTWTI